MKRNIQSNGSSHRDVIKAVIICVIVLIAIVLIVLNQNGLGFNNKQYNAGHDIDTINGPITCPYNSEFEKNNAKKPLPLPLAIKKLNDIDQPLNDSPYSMEQVFGANGARSQLITDAEYDHPPTKEWRLKDTTDDYVPKYALESDDTEDHRYGNPAVDGYSLCEINPSNDNEYYDPKLMNVKLKSVCSPLILSTTDEVELIGAEPEPLCVAKGLCDTAAQIPINSNPVLDIIRGTDNPLPGPFSGRYKKCNNTPQ